MWIKNEIFTPVIIINLFLSFHKMQYNILTYVNITIQELWNGDVFKKQKLVMLSSIQLNIYIYM